MAFSISRLVNKRNIVSLLFLIIFTWILFAATPNFHSYYVREIRNTSYMFLAGVALFFIHTLVLAPIKLEENNSQKYITLLGVCIVAFAFVETYLFVDIIKGMNNPGSNIFGITPGEVINPGSLIKVISALCIPLLIVGVLSIIHSLVIYGFHAISPYLEGFAHIVLIMMFLALAVTVPNIRSKDISLVLPLILVFYTNTFGITPILVRQKRTGTFLLGLITLILGCFLLQTILLTAFVVPSYSSSLGHPFTEGELWEIVFSTPALIVLGITLFLSFIYGYVRDRIKTKERSFNIKLGKKEAELKLLKSQVNPHFLFNTLNTLYATALNENAGKTGSSITKLASLLRFMQKDINSDFIPLENEIKYIKDYIAFQKLRCAVEPEVETEFVNIKNQLISPGLLIPFVENAFKYGIDPSKPSKLFIAVVCSGNNIHFSCINSYDYEFKPFHKEQGLGSGISNAKQRLELVYPENHTFEIKNKDNEFSVKISILIHAQE